MVPRIFIGGTHDGRWRELSVELPVIELPERQELPATVAVFVPQTAFFRREVYTLRQWHSDGERSRALYALQGLSDGEVFDRLLRGYEPESPSEPFVPE